MEIIVIFLGLIILNYIVGRALGNLDAWEMQILEEEKEEWSEDKRNILF